MTTTLLFKLSLSKTLIKKSLASGHISSEF